MYWQLRNQDPATSIPAVDFVSEIVDGNLKMTLGMIWTIILRFAIQDINVEGKKNSCDSVNFRCSIFTHDDDDDDDFQP